MKLTGIKYKITIITFIAAAAIAAFVPASGAEDPAKIEGRRGRLDIDFKSKINFVAEGRKYLKKNELKEALYNASYAVYYGFDAYDSYLLMADIYRASNDQAKEAAALEYAIAGAPNERLKSETQKRLLAVKDGLKNRSISRSAAAVVKNPSVSKVLRLGHTFGHFNEDERAAVQYEYADNMAAGLKSAKYARIKLYLKNGRQKQATDEIKKYFNLSPDDTSMVYLLAYNGFNLSLIKECGYNGEGGLDARRFNRTYADYHYEIGYGHYLKEKYDQAAVSLLYSLSYFKTNPRAHITLGEIYYKKGMFKEAGFHYNITSELTPGDYEINLKTAKSFVMSRQYERARTILRKLLKINPESDEYALWLTRTGLTRQSIERMGYIDTGSPFYKKKKPVKKAPGAIPVPGGPENLLRQPPSGPNSPFYHDDLQPIQIQL